MLSSKIGRVRNIKSLGRYLSTLAYLPVACNNFQLAIVSSKWNVESNNSLAGPNQSQPLWVNAGLSGTRLIEKLHLLKEAWLAVGIKSVSVLFDYCS